MTRRRENDAPSADATLRGAIALRAFTERKAKNSRNNENATPRRQFSRTNNPPKWPNGVLIFDTETTVDASQRLLFGSYRYCRWADSQLQCVEEGLFYADELPSEFAEQFGVLHKFAAAHGLKLQSRREFVERVFFPAACEARAIVVGFNLPFDLSRIAVDTGEGRGRFYGGFSFSLANYFDPATATWREDTYFARVCVKHIDSKRAFIGFSGGREPRKGKGFGGRFLDLKTLAFALTNASYSLRSACDAFGVTNGKATVEEHGRTSAEYIEYNRRDVQASQELLEKLRAEFDRHPIPLDPCRAYSPASIAKSYLTALGVAYPRQQFANISADIFGRAMSAYFGGRAEVRVRNTAVPVVYTDFLSMYPTVNCLLGLWPLLTAERIDIVEATDEVRDFLKGINAESCFRPDTWRHFRFFGQVAASDDILPTRAQYAPDNDAWNIGINRLTSEKPLWFAGPDLVASAVLTAKAPTVTRAFRLVPHGMQESLRPLKLGGEIAVDPRDGDFFRTVIEQRKALKFRTDVSAEDRQRLDQFLKVLANAGSYGVFAQMNAEDLRKDESAEITVHGISGQFDCETHSPELAGPFCFPPIAALIPSAARLMLALLEKAVTDAGGQYALCDTDSMAIVSTEHGGIIPCPGGPRRTGSGEPAIRALPWSVVRDIVRRFEALSPYDRAIIPGSVLKIEDENYASNGDNRDQRQLYAYAISAKRYALFERGENGEIRVLKASEHGLGHLLNPADPNADNADWITDTWHYLIPSDGNAAREPAWIDRPAISRITISAPSLLRPFETRAQKYSDRVKPFNFALSAHVAPFGHPVNVDPTRFHLMAPYERDARKWLHLPWRDVYSGNEFEIATGCDTPAGTVRVKSFRDVIEYYATHPEPKSAASEGSLCDRTTAGLLTRRRVTATSVEYVGKESNRIEDVEHGLVHSWDDVQEGYADQESEWRNVLHPVLIGMPRAVAAQATGLSERAISALRSGRSRPTRQTRRRIRALMVAEQHACLPGPNESAAPQRDV